MREGTEQRLLDGVLCGGMCSCDRSTAAGFQSRAMTSSWKCSWPLRDAINARSESARLALFSAGGWKQKRDGGFKQSRRWGKGEKSAGLVVCAWPNVVFCIHAIAAKQQLWEPSRMPQLRQI
jgi:hypothetical protein